MTRKWLTLLCLCIGVALACQRETGRLALDLDRPLKNSMWMGWRPWQRDTVALTEYQTVLGVFGDQVINVRSADVEAAPELRFRLGLMDGNQDGRFHTIGLDRVVLSEYGRDTTALDVSLPNQGPLSARTFVQIDRHYFLLTEIDSLGRSVRLASWDGRPPVEPAARMKTFLTKVPVATLEGEPHFLALNQRPRPTLLLLWSQGPDKGGLLTYLAENQAKWIDRFDIITVNALDDTERLQAFFSSLPCAFPTYRVTEQTCPALGCHAALPIAWLLAPDGAILRHRLHAREVLELVGD